MWFHQVLLIALVISLCCVTVTKNIIQVFGYKGGKARVPCSYVEGYESYEKYLCRNNCGSGDVLIKTTEAGKVKYSISDDMKKRVFTTTISNLQQNDAGKYWCGVTRNVKDYYPGEIQLSVMTDTCCDRSTKVQHYEGGSVSIRCPYESQYQNNLKYICRGNHPSTCLQQAVVTSNNKHNTRFSLTDDNKSTFTVTITSLNRTDSGSYLCGVERNTDFDVFSAVDLKTKENTCCDRSTKVQHYEGGSVSIRCPYESQYQNNLKYICRGNHPSTCLQQAVVTSNNKHNTRFSLTDDKKSTFTVTITSLNRTDSGSYLCGVERNTDIDVFSAVDMDVKENTCCDSSTKVQHYEGGSVSIRCPYEPQYQNNLKYICRGNRPSTCLQQAVVTSNNKHNTRFSLTDDNKSTFTVTITRLNRTDSGSYLCGVERNTDVDVFSAVDLEVKENTCCDSSTTVQTYEGGSVSIRCSYESQYQNNLKYICRGNRPSTCLQQAVVTSHNKHNTRFSLTDDKESTFTLTITSLNRTDSGSYLCGVQRKTDFDVFSAVDLEVKDVGTFDAVVFIVPAVLLFLLIVVLVIVYKHRHPKVKDTGVKETRTNAEEVVVECDIYANEDVVYSKMKKKSKRSAPQDTVYGNYYIDEDIYCNQVYSNQG